MKKQAEPAIRKVQEYLKMSNRPVGIKLIREGDIIDDSGYDSPTDGETFCWYVHEAAKGRDFLMRQADLDCNKAEIVLGLRKPRFGNMEPRIKEEITGIRIGPIEGADVVMLVLYPDQTMTIAHLIPGISVPLRKNRTVCGDGMAQVFNTRQPTISLLCVGARTDGEFNAGEMLVTLPYEIFMELPAKMNRFKSLSLQAMAGFSRRLRRAGRARTK